MKAEAGRRCFHPDFLPLLPLPVSSASAPKRFHLLRLSSFILHPSSFPSMPAKVYTDKDADLALLSAKTCAVIGFGSQGHAHALNLKDSGMNVVVGLYPGSPSRTVAAEKGLAVMDTAEAVKEADVIFLAVPGFEDRRRVRKGRSSPSDEGQDALIFAWFCHSLQDGDTAAGGGRDHGRAQGAGPTSCAASMSRVKACPR